MGAQRFCQALCEMAQVFSYLIILLGSLNSFKKFHLFWFVFHIPSDFNNGSGENRVDLGVSEVSEHLPDSSDQNHSGFPIKYISFQRLSSKIFGK